MESNSKPIVSLVLFQRPGGQTESKKKRNKAAERMLPSPAFTPNIATLHCWLVVAPCFFFGGELSSLPNAKDLEAQYKQCWLDEIPSKKKCPLGMTTPKIVSAGSQFNGTLPSCILYNSSQSSGRRLFHACSDHLQ